MIIGIRIPNQRRAPRQFARCRFWFLTISVILSGAFQAAAQLPVLGSSGVHDPSTMIKDGTNYFVYGDGQGIQVQTSSDLRNWTYASVVFPSGPPAWTINDIPAITNIVSGTTNIIPAFAGYFWAPDIAYFNGRFNLYYSASQWGTRNSAIGVVTSPSLTSPVWTDQGKVVESYYPAKANTDTIAFNCIDPGILVATNGTVWMSYGSYSDGIVVTQINPTTGLRLNTASIGTKVASTTTSYDQNTAEGSCLYQRGGYYYLFLNYGGCCAGVNSTYNIRVGRSTSVTGPYLDRNGVNMLNGGGTVLLESTGRYIGPGHAAIMDENGTNWFTYHYYDGNNNGNATLGLNRIYWTADNWPALTNDWSAFYTFNTDAREHRALYNGSLKSGASITNDPALGKVLNLNGTTNYVSLPISVANASTFATWVKWNGGADGQHVFDFGTDTTNYFSLSPRASSGNLRFAITTNGPGAEQRIEASVALPSNSWCHVAVTLDGAKGILYLNGNPIAANNSLTIRPWQTGWESAKDGVVETNFLGGSKFGTPFFNGRISSFRIFGRPLSGPEIRDLAWAEPSLAHRYSFNSGTSNVWDSVGMAHGTLMGNAIVTNGALQLTGASGGYVNLPGGLVSGSSAVTLEFWATFGANGNWARVVDFGNISGSSGQNYFYFCPHNGSSEQTVERKNNSTTTTFAFTPTLDNRTVHVVCIVDPANNYAAVYTNGVLEATRSGSWTVFTSVSSAWSFIGRSLFSTDAYLNATIDELRFYDGRLTPAEIATDYQSGPDALALPITLVSSNSTTGLTFAWPSWASGFVLQSTTNLAVGAWTPVTHTPGLANDQWLLTVSLTNSENFYRLQR